MQATGRVVFPGAPDQSSGARKRCISSLQVTYHQEIHKPTPRLLPPAYTETRYNAAHTYSATVLIPSSSCVPVEQSLEDVYLQEGDLEHDQSDLDFYPAQQLHHPSPAPTAHALQPPVLQHPPAPVKEEPSHLPPCYQTPNSPLFGI